MNYGMTMMVRKRGVGLYTGDMGLPSALGPVITGIADGGDAIAAAADAFAVGSVAHLVTPHKDYEGHEITAYRKMPNGNWSSETQHLEYFTSFARLNAKHPVHQVLLGRQVVWPAKEAAPPLARPESKPAAKKPAASVTPSQPAAQGGAGGVPTWLWALGAFLFLK